MSTGLSLYLDLLRFMMALEVMLGHSTFHAYTGKGFLWQIDPFRHLQTAVIAFFVLSGFVIGFTSHVKEKLLSDYACSRIARMHSVIVPALLVTLIFDSLGTAINPGFYKTWDFPTPIGDEQLLRYVLSFFYMNNTWFLPHMNPGTNGPFWTMTYEVMFYAIFGVFWYCKGKYKILFSIPLILIAGKSILILFPLWLLGVATYYIQRKISLPKYWAGSVFLVSSILLVLCSNLRPGVEIQFTGRATHLDYAEGLLFAVNIFSASGMASFLETLLGKYHRLIRWLGMLTFSLYLCHRPLLNFFSVFAVDVSNAYVQKVWLFGATFAIVIAVAYLGEWLRVRIKSALLAMVRGSVRQCVSIG